MAYGVGASAAIAAQMATASALCLPAPLIKVNPNTFLELVADLFTIVHGRDRGYHVYLGRYLDQFVIYTRTSTPLQVPVEIKALQIAKTIRL
jgi:hypothetical protein